MDEEERMVVHVFAAGLIKRAAGVEAESRLRGRRRYTA